MNQSSPTNRPSTNCLIGHFFGFGFMGQLFFTLLQWDIVQHGTGRAQAEHSLNVQLMLLGLPLVFGLLGVCAARTEPISGLSHPVGSALALVAVMMLGFINVFLLLLTLWPGYC